MADKTMPERIWAWEQDGFRDFDNMAGWKENGIESDFDGAEYVRADIAAGDPNEPIEDGQYRWCRVNEEGRWEPVAIREGYGRLVYYIAGEEQNDYVEDCYEMGPVIRPPADTAS